MPLNISALQDEILDQYLHDENPRPWIVGFSGGKDSTMLLQLVWYSIKQIPAELRKRQVYVVCNNTLVENPKIITYTEEVLDRIEKAAFDQSMPVFVVRTTPKLEDSFWVNLIGKGYPAPNNAFRWCTERLKISPTTEFIKNKISEVGEAIILLGTRSDESSTRARSMKKHEVDGQRLRKHILSNAYVYAPIKDVVVSELWQYLNQVPSPWGANNKMLNALYRNANGGDCPLVIDDTTPSCGNSRFGCWVCTVVSKDKSMDALIENGEEWMEPLAEMRDMLVEYRNHEDWREQTRRDGSEGVGPYTIDKRAYILQTLLKAQKEVNQEEPDISLINYQELVAIQVTWYRDNHFQHSVADIYNKIYGTQLTDHDFKDHLIFEKEILKESCAEHPEDYQLINELLELQKAKTILVRARGLQNDLENRLDQFVKSN
ncbi:DNA phosphorothioation system sulfurtransferase DndC [uncultured Imperialibacter sp.]|uniref:DNA phosphorothioation system sulfurtransferase DndC n=1 Tax=uncultured Imperialibacter sp. TaxID=1672639 RepID=UPI0030D83ACE|tara:strand:- start:221 stop:1516 length:1296 start_codon:yes stop_codon:yes gene_type:complete